MCALLSLAYATVFLFVVYIDARFDVSWPAWAFILASASIQLWSRLKHPEDWKREPPIGIYPSRHRDPSRWPDSLLRERKLGPYAEDE